MNEDEQHQFKRLKKENEELRNQIRNNGGILPSEEKYKKIPLDVQNEYLKQILAIDKAIRSDSKTTVYEAIGRPSFQKSVSISDKEITTKLRRVTEFLKKNDIIIDTIYKVDDRVLYEFITEDLINEEFTHIEGLITHFRYEEFQPNHEYDLKKETQNFLKVFLSDKKDAYNLFMHGELDKAIIDFYDSFSKFNISTLLIENTKYNEVSATVTFSISYSGQIEDSSEWVKFTGSGSIEFIYEFGYWYIDSISLPVKFLS